MCVCVVTLQSVYVCVRVRAVSRDIIINDVASYERNKQWDSSSIHTHILNHRWHTKSEGTLCTYLVLV